jgi:hypothetical protein
VQLEFGQVLLELRSLRVEEGSLILQVLSLLLKPERLLRSFLEGGGLMNNKGFHLF